jgi:hypothetical protein
MTLNYLIYCKYTNSINGSGEVSVATPNKNEHAADI